MSCRRGITVSGYTVLPDPGILRLATRLRRLTGLCNLSPVEAGHGIVNQSRCRASIALRTHEAVGRAAHRFFGSCSSVTTSPYCTSGLVNSVEQIGQCVLPCSKSRSRCTCGLVLPIVTPLVSLLPPKAG